jgi:diacylglycerol kinase family enzyme
VPGGAFAIYLNANARRVNADVVARIEELVHPDDIFYCSSQAEARAYAHRIVERQYPTVFTGGGDGTVVQLINALVEVTGGRLGTGLPTLGVLSLGTGNALSRVVSSGSAVQDLKAYVSNPSRDVVDTAMVRSEGQLFPFGGMGIDAEILADYDAMKATVGAGPLKPLFRNVGGYFVAFFGATAPRRISAFVRREVPSVKVVNHGTARFLGPDGNPVRTFGPGDVLFEGAISAAVVGTTPLIGYGMRLLPFADRDPGSFQLRVATIGMARALVNLRGVWKGTYRSDTLLDFHVQHVTIECSRPMPFQMAGELVGGRDRFDLEVVPNAVRLLRFI